MALTKKPLKEIPARTRQTYQKALDMAGRDPAYAMLIALDIVKQEPGFMEARKLLRDIERRKNTKKGFFAALSSKFKITGKMTKASSMLKKDPMSALALAEEVLAIDLNTPQALNLLVDASTILQAPFIATEALEILHSMNPNDISVLEKLADAWKRDGDGAQVLRIRQKICDLKPGDMDLQQKLREAAALATLTQGSWGESSDGGSFRDKMKNADDAKKLEQQDRIARNAEDVAELIADFEGRIAEGDDSIDLRRKLAEYYQRSDRHEDAIAAYRWIAEKTGRLDPAIDKAIEKSEIAIILSGIAAAPEKEEEIRQEVYNLQLSRAETRVANYPNDLLLRFELGELCWEGGAYDEALEQFQLAQRNPQKRLAAIVFIGRIFHIKKQYDMAKEQFEKALKEMLIMDAAKMDTLYFFGCLCEDAGNPERARECFRQIYQSNVKYRDVKQRIEGSAS